MFFARFINLFLCDIGVTDKEEPFEKLITQGVVRGKTFCLADSGGYVHEGDVIDSQGSSLFTYSSHAQLVHLFFRPTHAEIDWKRGHSVL